jgi:hypothetical protein
MTTRVFPHGLHPNANTVVNGRTVSAPAALFNDVADHDAAVLEANGWSIAGKVGTTAQRPTTGLVPGKTQYIDTTVNAVVMWDGLAWRNLLTGASV